MHLLITWLILFASLLIGNTSGGISTPAKQQANAVQSTITYVLRHPFHTVRGVNTQVSSHINYNYEGSIASVEVSAPVKYFDSGNKTRDKDMLKVTEAGKYPDVTFNSSGITTRNSRLNVTGKLTFHGVTKTIAFEAGQQLNNGNLVVTGQFTISLEEYAIKRPSVLGLAVKDKLLVQFRMVYPAPTPDN